MWFLIGSVLVLVLIMVAALVSDVHGNHTIGGLNRGSFDAGT